MPKTAPYATLYITKSTLQLEHANNLDLTSNVAYLHYKLLRDD